MSQTFEPTVHLALRFHVNLYHSYRGDSLDDRGIGKDIRIIRRLLDGLDALNAAGIPVRGTWDIENYYSLELYLPKHAPDILARIRGRVARGLDEVELMSYNNGILTAHTASEFEDAIGRAITNPQGSGVADLFPEWAPVVRPQECMFSTSQIAGYRKLGVEVLSVFYSAAPFNGFSSFVPALPLAQRYNPLIVRDAATGAEMKLLPAYSPADIVERFGSLRRWLKEIRRAQLRLADPCDLLLLIDMDADDSFWEGILPGFASRLAPSLCGFEPLVRSVADLPWLRFSRPWDYIRAHEVAGTVTFGQDLADGSFDGYSSWAEKGENARLWPRIARARRIAGVAERVAAERGASADPAFTDARDRTRTALLLSLSTTHFGMASPVMNADRLKDGFRRAETAVDAAAEALELARSTGGSPSGPVWYFDPRIDALPRGEGVLSEMPGIPGTTGTLTGTLHLLNPDASRTLEPEASLPAAGLTAGPDFLRSGTLEVRVLQGGGVMINRCGEPLFEAPLSRPWVRYAGRVRRPTDPPRVSVREVLAGRVGEFRLDGTIPLGRSRSEADVVHWTHVYTLAAGLSTVRVDVSVTYPHTARVGFKRGRAVRLAREWDARFREVVPFELVPALGATGAAPARVWKHGFDDAVGSYVLDYHRFAPNDEPDSLDNHVTDGWVAVAGGGKGLLIAQSDAAQTVYAFCPMRVRFQGERQSVHLNPFGSYYGAQWRTPTATTGLGRLAAVRTGDNFDPYAPSWEGETLHISLLLAPYDGDRPPDALQRDALLHAMTPIRV